MRWVNGDLKFRQTVSLRHHPHTTRSRDSNWVGGKTVCPCCSPHDDEMGENNVPYEVEVGTHALSGVADSSNVGY